MDFRKPSVRGQREATGGAPSNSVFFGQLRTDSCLQVQQVAADRIQINHQSFSIIIILSLLYPYQRVIKHVAYRRRPRCAPEGARQHRIQGVTKIATHGSKAFRCRYARGICRRRDQGRTKACTERAHLGMTTHAHGNA